MTERTEIHLTKHSTYPIEHITMNNIITKIIITKYTRNHNASIKKIYCKYYYMANIKLGETN